MATAQKRVLIVDDDAQVRSLLAVVLRRHYLTVDVASEGGAAMELLRQFPYAVVLVDLIMPGIDGFQLLDAISAEGVVSPPVVLVITGADRSAVDRLDVQRIHGIVRKPFDPEEVARLVVACAEIRNRGPFGAMAMAAMIAGSPFLALLNRLS